MQMSYIVKRSQSSKCRNILQIYRYFRWFFDGILWSENGLDEKKRRLLKIIFFNVPTLFLGRTKLMNARWIQMCRWIYFFNILHNVLYMIIYSIFSHVPEILDYIYLYIYNFSNICESIICRETFFRVTA